jgi:hypothetical protein
LAIVVYRLLELGPDIRFSMLQGLGAIACMLIGLGIFLWCVRWGVTQDDLQEEARARKEHGPATE